MYLQSIVKLMIAINLFFVQGCQIIEDESDLISNKNQIENTLIELQSTTQSFAFWSFCIPTWNVYEFPIVENVLPYDNRNQQLLFYMNSETRNSPTIIFMYVDLAGGSENKIVHKLHINSELQDKTYEYKFDSKTYEGTWILSMITLELKQIKFQTSGSTDYHVIQEEMFECNKFFFTIGGTGIVRQHELGIFRGRLSKLIQLQNEPTHTFEWVYNNCFVNIYSKIGHTIHLIDDVLDFQGNKDLTKEISQVGKSFRFYCWVKYDFSEASFTTTYLLLRLTIYSNYGEEIKFGDALAKITVDLDNSQPKNCGYDITDKSINNTPILPISWVQQTEQWERLKFRDTESESYYYQELQQEWHIVSFSYEQLNGPSMSLNFVSSNKIILKKFPDVKYQGLFINTNYYAIIGSDRTILSKLRGKIANARFEYNYETTPQLIIGCHYTCKQCNGPQPSNCLECFSEQNRIFSEDLKTCSCKQGFTEVIGECKSFSEIYSKIKVLDVPIKQKISYCDVGYFSIPTSNQCIKCPQENKKMILCADCLIYQTFKYNLFNCNILTLLKQYLVFKACVYNGLYS